MINANLSQFLDTGWFSEATLYYNGYTYWCEGSWNSLREKPFHFFVYRYRSIIVDDIYTKRLIENGDVVDFSTVFEVYGLNEFEVKEKFLSAKIFEDKSFWEIEESIAWYEEI